jgi:propionyl-CoA synthetase
MGYSEVYEGWKADPEAFWMEAAKAIDWTKPPTRALNDANPPFYRWFEDGEANTCWNCVDRHVEAGRGDQAAFIYDSPITGAKRTITFSELKDEVAQLAGALARRGVSKGDRVIIYMPMVPEACISMLACARIGAVHSVVFGGFASNELAVRIDDAKPKAILSASCGIEPGRIVEYKPLLDAAVDAATHKPDFCALLQRHQHPARLDSNFYVDWTTFIEDAEPADCVPVGGMDPLYIMYTSGTTGQPKGVVRPSGGHMVALHWTMKNLYGVDPGEVFWAASDVGWVVGHSYICYAPLLAGNTAIIFEGKPVGTPDAGTFWRVMSEHKVASFFTAPTAFRAIKRDDPTGEFVRKYDLSHLRLLFLAGERADPDTIKWAEEQVKIPVIDHWWQTETGWCIAGNPAGIEILPVKYGSSSVPMPGYDVQILDETGHPVGPNTLGAIAIKMPLPPGCLPTLWNADQRYIDSYMTAFPGYYDTSDAGIIDEDDQLKGQLPLGFLCLNAGCNRPHGEIVGECVQRVRDEIGPVAAFKLATVVDRLPKTRSGKILRATMAKIADGEEYKAPATIDDPAILDEITEALKAIGYPGAA